MSPLEQLPNTYRVFFGGFPSLTLAQNALIQPILENRDVVLQAGTGLGKTEAVLAPATERLLTSPGHFTILFIVPTRALALDMHRRIQPLYQNLGLKSGMRTGDGKTQKEGKPHLLVITPESLDVLLGSQNKENSYFLQHVRILIIDEVHTFLGTERGSQLAYLRQRLIAQAKEPLQTLTLSATIGDPNDISAFFRLNNVFHYQQPTPRKLEPFWVHIMDERRELVSFFNDLSALWKCKKLLVFTNSRKKCEELFEILNYEGIFSQSVLLHYSNLSTKERRIVESTFRNRKQSLCIATSTLEMGIDIGDIDGVVMVGPPSSAAAFLQRIGRGNRKKDSLKFWGVCYGAEADLHLLRFLALFSLAEKNTLGTSLAVKYYSVLFQQILSCLYAGGIVYKNSLQTLFSEPELSSIVEEMIDKKWLKKGTKPGLLFGGIPYKIALRKQKIWSNFPPTDEDYQVILDKEVIATLPLPIVKQIKIGDVFQLTGRELKLLQIEEKKTSRELLVTLSNEPLSKEIFWSGCAAPVSFEVAQAIKSILLDESKITGLFTRTQRLLERTKRTYQHGPNDLYVYRLETGAYRYDTFLGSIGNFILCFEIKEQLSQTIEELCVDFDELGIESNQWFSFESLTLPYEASLFQQWVDNHLPLLQQTFPWNSWLWFLPKDLQKKEIGSRLFDPRVVEQFKRYSTQPMPLIPPPPRLSSKDEKMIPLKGKPWSLTDERKRWEVLTFPKWTENTDHALTASQLHHYVAQKTCSRLAYFQRVHFRIEPNPLFPLPSNNSHFKEQVFATLDPLHFATKTFTLQKAIDEVLLHQTPLFLARAEIKIAHPFPMQGTPDLLYLKPKGSNVLIEVWDIKDQETFTYAQKWRLTFYVYLLQSYLKKAPVILSDYAGLVHRNGKKQVRIPFALTHFLSWIPHLITQWRTASLQPPTQYTLHGSCSFCRYFSYCYQETLLNNEPSSKSSEIICVEPESIETPPNKHDWPSLQLFLQKHFIWPVDGLLTATQVGKCLGVITDPTPPTSLYHDDKAVSPDLCEKIWSWATLYVQNKRPLQPSPTHLIDAYLYRQRQEWEERTFSILAFQKNPLSERVEQFRAIGPLTFLNIMAEKKDIHYLFSFDPKSPISKFRVGDFLKLSFVNALEIQKGFSVVLTSYSPEKGTLSIQALFQKLSLHKKQLYALDECADDGNKLKIETVLHRLKDPKFRPDLIQVFHGQGKDSPSMAEKWVMQWYYLHAEKAHLNQRQQEALLLPFKKNIGFIEGPPGTGKTHLLVWTLAALIAQAKATHRPIKLLVTALTHRAIDQILHKLAKTIGNRESIPIWKYGRFDENQVGIEPLLDAKLLLKNSSFVLGSTGFSVYQLLEKKKFPQLFDWVIFDEASQMLPSYACLSLVFGKGNALFYGDRQQLSPILIGKSSTYSVFEELLSRFDSQYHLRLNETYRMNDQICDFVSKHWYDFELKSVAGKTRIELPEYPLFSDSIDAYLDPSNPLTVVPIEHEGNLHSSKEEAEWIAKAVKRLVVDYCFPMDSIGIISPHRLQNNTLLKAIKQALPLSTQYPKIDTVERMQGQEFDCVFFSAIASDQQACHNPFLKDYRRFNVSISRARKKFFFVASPLFFQSFPKTEKELLAHFPFEDFFIQSKRESLSKIKKDL